MSEESAPAAPVPPEAAAAAPGWLATLHAPPWPKLIAWAVLLAALWFFRGFFFVGFLTFLLCWLVRGFVGLLKHRFAAGKPSERLEWWLTVAAFVSLFIVAGVAWEVVVPRFMRQGQALLSRVVQFDVQDELNQFLTRTVGDYLFRKTYGRPDSPDYQKAFAEFRNAGRGGQGLYDHFPALRSALVSRFESETEQAKIRQLQAKLLRGDEVAKKFDSWFLETKAPALFEKNREALVAQWAAEQQKKFGAKALAERQQAPDFVAQRDAEIRRRLLADAKQDPVLFGALRQECEEAAANREWAAIRQSPEYQADFKAYYDARRQADPAAVPFDYAKFRALEEAYPKGKAAFAAALGELILPAGGAGADKLAHEDFELSQRRQLAAHWWETDPAALAIKERLFALAPELFSDFESWLGGLFRSLLGLPMELMTAFFFALYITLDLPNLRRRAQALGRGSLGVYYDAVVPDLALLSQQLGVFFQSRVLVALFNTGLTFLALWALGIESELLLCLVVFVTSFIPIVGVFIAGVPIVLIAIVQPGGSMGLALKAAAAVTVVHLIEANIFSPYLLSKTAELHPITVLLALVVGEHFFGMWGLILGVPVAAFLGHLFGGKAEAETEANPADEAPPHPDGPADPQATEPMTEPISPPPAAAAPQPGKHKKKRWRK